MKKTILQFLSLEQLTAFVDRAKLINFEINRTSFLLICEIDTATAEVAKTMYQATLLQPKLAG